MYPWRRYTYTHRDHLHLRYYLIPINNIKGVSDAEIEKNKVIAKEFNARCKEAFTHTGNLKKVHLCDKMLIGGAIAWASISVVLILAYRIAKRQYQSNENINKDNLMTKTVVSATSTL